MSADLTTHQKDFLNSLYFDISKPAAYTSLSKFYKELIKEGRTDFSLNQVKKWLSSQETHTLHKPVRKTFKRRRVIVQSIDEQWDSDLMVMESTSKDNDGYRYILLCIDTLSKYVWLRPLKNKTGAQMKTAFQDIFSGSRQCLRLRSDKGKEYCCNIMEKYFKEIGINHFVTYNKVQANFAERCNRTIKQRLFKYFTHQQTYRYIDILQDIATNYNATFHRSIKMAPKDVTTENQQIVWENIYGDDITKLGSASAKFSYKVGDLVRLSHTRGVFSRGYNQGWSDEIFIIKARHKTAPSTYSLKDFLGEAILGTVYEAEITKVLESDNPVYRVEKVLKKRRRQGVQEYFVKWDGWDKRYNSWVTSDEMVQLKDQ